MDFEWSGLHTYSSKLIQRNMLSGFCATWFVGSDKRNVAQSKWATLLSLSSNKSSQNL